MTAITHPEGEPNYREINRRQPFVSADPTNGGYAVQGDVDCALVVTLLRAIARTSEYRRHVGRLINRYRMIRGVIRRRAELPRSSL